MWPFFNPTIEVVTFHLRGWCMLIVFLVAGIHQTRTSMSGSFESMWWNAIVHRLDVDSYFHLKEFWGNGVKTHVNSSKKSPLPEKFSPEEDQTHDAAASRTASPTCYQWAILAPFRHTNPYTMPELLSTCCYVRLYNNNFKVSWNGSTRAHMGTSEHSDVVMGWNSTWQLTFLIAVHVISLQQRANLLTSWDSFKEYTSP